MKKLKKSINTYLIVSLFLTVCFPAGIVGIVTGASRSITPLLVGGIVATILGFYVMPMTWIKFAELKSWKWLLSAIENDNIYDVKTLSMQLAKPQTQIQSNINSLIEKRYLTGYLFVDKQYLEPNNNAKKSQGNKCPNCGSLMNKDAENCEYCGFKR